MPRVSSAQFWTEPYRLLFPFAALVGAAGVGSWTLTLTGSSPLPPMSSTQHGLLLLLGAIGSGILGFLGTAFPRQNQGPQTRWPLMLGGAGMQAAVVALMVVGWWVPAAQSAALGLAALLWAAVGVWSARIALPSLRRRVDPTTLLIPFATWVLSAAALVALESPSAGIQVALFGGFIPISVVLLDRMIPFFSRNLPGFDGHRNGGMLPALAGLILLRLVGAQLLELPILTAGASLGLAAVLARQAHGWRPWIGLREPLVAVLHFGWIAFFVGFLSDAAAAMGAGSPSAALHFFTMGLVILLLGFGLRVLRGHAGRSVLLGRDGGVLISLAVGALVGRGALPLLGVHDPLWIWVVPGALLSLAFAFWGLHWGRLVAHASR